MAIIVEKDAEGRPSRIKSITFPPSIEERDSALELDLLLQKRIPEIENMLIEHGLLSSEIPDQSAPARGGNTELWWNLGCLLRPIVEDKHLVKPKERRYLWEAIRLYATRRIQRVDRGPSRIHWDYCYRISKFPWEFVRRLNWDDWVFFIDSKSLRQEQRIDDWMQSRMKKLLSLSRSQFRALARELNRAFKNKDTSVFSSEELFATYDRALKNVTTSDNNERGSHKSKKTIRK